MVGWARLQVTAHEKPGRSHHLGDQADRKIASCALTRRLWYTCVPHSSEPYVSGEEIKVTMDLFHRKLQGKGKDTPTGRDCQFCCRADPDFTKRDPMDRLVLSKLDDTAAAHITEDGYVRHRIAELMKKRALGCIEVGLAKSA
jgi:hypothetical protein